MRVTACGIFMKGSLETMIGIIFLAFMALLGTSYITASLTTQKAQNYHAGVVAELEASDFASDVITSCETKAVDNGYNSLTITVNGSGQGRYAKVVLDYDYSIPLLNRIIDHEIVGYAR